MKGAMHEPCGGDNTELWMNSITPCINLVIFVHFVGFDQT